MHDWPTDVGEKRDFGMNWMWGHDVSLLIGCSEWCHIININYPVKNP